MPIPFIALIWHFVRTVRGLLKDPETRGVVYLVGLLLLGGMFFYHSVEGWSWLDSLYFSVITLATVGYGDFSPKTDAGKIFTMIYIVIGLGVLAGFISLVAQKQNEQRRGRREQESSADATDEQEET